MNPDKLPRAFWRVFGLAIIALAIALLGIAMVLGVGFLSKAMNDPGIGLLNLAIGFSLLCGFGTVLLFSGANLLLIDRPVTRVELVPWQALVFAGGLVSSALVVSLITLILQEQSHLGAAAKGFGIMLGIGLGFMISGWKQRKKREKSFFR